MKTDALTTRRRTLVIGALVADAAAMGLHWIYDQDHIQKIAADKPEFRAPDAAHYKDVMGFFAHPTRQIGDPSQYGEQLLVMLRCLTQNNNEYNVETYAAAFRAHFGYGGGYVGYIDHATRDTLDNFRRAQDDALSRAQALPFDGAASVTTAMVTKAMALSTQYAGDELRAKFEEAVRITHNDDAVLAHGFAVLDQIIAAPPATGANDQQLPAIAKLPPLVALLSEDAGFEQAVDSAVKVTSDHERAAAFGRVSGAMMRAAVQTGDAQAIAEAGRAQATPDTDALLADALTRLEASSNDVTKHFGMACDLNYGVPSVLHNVLTAPNYTEAVRRNIYAGGDTCGRAILLGALAGAMHGLGGEKGIPQSWIDTLTHKGELLRGLDTLLG
jgi:ADP-ribosylglycohydrolase